MGGTRAGIGFFQEFFSSQNKRIKTTCCPPVFGFKLENMGFELFFSSVLLIVSRCTREFLTNNSFLLTFCFLLFIIDYYGL